MKTDIHNRAATRFMAVLTFALVCFAVSSARADVITFTADPMGPQPNGFQSVESNLVTFSDTMGADLQLADFGNQSFGNALAVFGDDASALLMNFSVLITSMSLSFGNDDPGFSQPGDRAVLTLFLGGVEVAQNSIVLNRDDIMNQTIFFTGATFDSATFQYTTGNPQVPIALIEIVDNITFSPIPEPSTWAAMALGSGLLALRFRRRR